MLCMFVASFSLLSGFFPDDDLSSGRFVIGAMAIFDYLGMVAMIGSEWAAQPPYASMASAAGGRSLDPSSSQIPDPNVKSQCQKQSFGRKPQIPKERTGGWELVKPLGSDQIPTSLRVSQNRNRKV